MRMKSLFLCFLGILLFIAIVSGDTDEPFAPSDIVQSPSVTASYTEHSPILITSNDDFETQGWPGSGTEEDPYLIQNLNITDSSSCILITDTTVYYEITDCLISAPSQASSDGITLYNATHGTIRNCSVELHQTAFVIVDSPNCTLVDNAACSNSHRGFVVSESADCILSNNTAAETGQCGFYISSENCTLTNNTSTGNGVGYYLWYANHCNLLNNTASNNNFYGFEAGYSNDCTLKNNTAIHNTLTGIHLDDTTSNILVYLNTIAFNYPNAFDFGSSNSWDNGTHGNFWGDYDGSESYYVGGEPEFYDNHPFGIRIAPPFMNQPNDIEYEGGSTGNTITWHSWDMNPDSYKVYRNGSCLETASWNGSDIIIDIDGLDVGAYNYTAIANDTYGKSTNDSVIVTVVDTTAPSIDHPADIGFEIGTIGHSVVWNVSDWTPALYEVYRNGTSILSGTWNGSAIEIDLDELDVGVYNYTLVVSDQNGYTANDSVMVTVRDTIAPTIDHPNDIEYEVGTTGHSILWNPSDADADRYELYRNGTLVASSSWDGSTINIGVDGLAVATYNYTVIVYDQSGNSASDTVMVSVTSTTSDTTTTTETTGPQGIDPMLIIIGVAGAIGVVILAVVYIKTRR